MREIMDVALISYSYTPSLHSTIAAFRTMLSDRPIILREKACRGSSASRDTYPHQLLSSITILGNKTRLPVSIFVFEDGSEV
jgi:hypothetical protein